MRKQILIAVTTLIGAQSMAQVNQQERANQLQLNTITTAVPFLLITPDSRSGAMGDAGIAMSADANSIHTNPAKLALNKDEMAISISYVPWLRQLVNDINLAYVSMYKKLDESSAIGGSLRYFSLGDITFTDITGATIRNFNPNEFAIDLAYSRKLSDNLYGGVAARYIYSNLTGGINVGGADTRPGMSGAADIGLHYVSNEFEVSGKPATISAGMNISNIGAKMSYSDRSRRDFLPTNMRLGTCFKVDVDEYNSIAILADFNKLLVPTPPAYLLINGSPAFDGDRPLIASGRDNDVTVASGIFGSFTDAPGIVLYDENDQPYVVKGSRFREELREINISVGAEYWYNNLFAFRAGFFNEHWTKGRRQFISFGSGIKFSKFQLDLSYLLSTRQNNPLQNTLRFSLSYNFSKTEGSSAKMN
ncbi:MAG: type IX secretion system outer membrane channel protein PorV [Flavobacteriales bacterium]